MKTELHDSYGIFYSLTVDTVRKALFSNMPQVTEHHSYQLVLPPQTGMTSYQLIPSLCHVPKDMTLLQKSRHCYRNIRTRNVSVTIHEECFRNKLTNASEQLRA